MDFIPDKGNRVRQSRKSLIVGGAINPGQLADLFPPEGKDTSSQAVFVYLYLVFFLTVLYLGIWWKVHITSYGRRTPPGSPETPIE